MYLCIYLIIHDLFDSHTLFEVGIRESDTKIRFRVLLASDSVN